MPFVERQQLVGNLKSVDQTFEFDDFDGTACDAIERMLAFYPFNDVIFANGGDRTATNIPEMRLQGLHPARLRFAFGVGGDIKMNSSSSILANFEAHVKRHYDDKTNLATSPDRPENPGRSEASKALRAHALGRRRASQVSADAQGVGGVIQPWPDLSTSRWSGRVDIHDLPVGTGLEGQD